MNIWTWNVSKMNEFYYLDGIDYLQYQWLDGLILYCSLQ